MTAIDQIEISEEWEKTEDRRLRRNVEVEHFVNAVDLLNKIATVAEEKKHHPDLCIHGYHQLEIIVYTHEADGLTEKDYVLAQKIDEIVDSVQTKNA